MPNKLRSAREEPESSLKPRTASPVTPFLSKWSSGAEQAGPEICRFSQANRAYRDEAKEAHTMASLHNVQAKEMKWSSGAEQAGPEICRFSQANRAYRDAGSRDEQSLRLPARRTKHTLWLLFITYKSFAFY
ncbi:mixed lineage kinase domain-like [Sarotherodon galilaeus]